MGDHAWKGLDPSVTPIFLSYDQTEGMIAALLDRVALWQPDLVVGIMRGGLVPATMAAAILAQPLAAISYQRANGTVSWLGPLPAGKRVLLVDDACSTGRTMVAVRNALLQEGRSCLTLTVVYDPDRTAYVPDLSHSMKALWRFPWERGEGTPAGKLLRATGAAPDIGTEAPFTGLDLDGVFLPDIEAAAYEADLHAALARRDGLEPFPFLPFFNPGRAVIITGRPEIDRARTETWLEKYGIHIPLECRPDSMGHDLRSVADFKAITALRRGCTHFVESDPVQAILIAAAMPHLIVTWWPGADGRACVVRAAERPMTAQA